MSNDIVGADANVHHHTTTTTTTTTTSTITTTVILMSVLLLILSLAILVWLPYTLWLLYSYVILPLSKATCLVLFHVTQLGSFLLFLMWFYVLLFELENYFFTTFCMSVLSGSD